MRSGTRALLRTLPTDGTEGTEEVFDLASDPAETRGITPGPAAAELRDRLDAHLAIPDGAGSLAGSRELSPALKKMLESFGYIQ